METNKKVINLSDVLDTDTVIKDIYHSNYLQRLLLLSTLTDNFNINTIKDIRVKTMYQSLLNADGKINLIINTSNRNKIIELQNYFKYNRIGQILNNIFSVVQLGINDNPSKEEFNSFIGNAASKNDSVISDFFQSEFRSKNFHYLLMADDSGFISWQFPNILGVRSKRFAEDQKEFIRYKLGEKFYSEITRNYTYNLNNIVLCEYIIESMNARNISIDDFDRRCSLVTGIDLTAYKVNNETKKINKVISTNSIGTMGCYLRLEDMLNYKTTNINHCKFGFNSLVDIELNFSKTTLQFKYDTLDDMSAIKFNHRQSAFSEGLIRFLEITFQYCFKI